MRNGNRKLAHTIWRYSCAIGAIACVTFALHTISERVNSTTVALALLLAVLFIATFLGSRPALAASLVAMLTFNFFFLPPYYTFAVAEPQNWVALGAFLLTAITVGQLSARARRRAAEALRSQTEIERLYQELRLAFEQASHAEAWRQSEALKSALLDAVTHDIRTPLTSIKASVTTLLEEQSSGAALDAEGRNELLSVIDEETDRLNNLVEGLIDLARIEAGEMKLRQRWGVIDDIISAALERAAPLSRGHAVSVAIQEELPAIRVDSAGVAEVVYTLVDNATKYSPQGTTISVLVSRASDELIQIAVEDEGPGIPSNLRERVFEKFFRVQLPVNSQRPAGAGIGLAIALGIVEAHGGSIWVEDRSIGTGARVVFTIPIGDEDSIDIEQPESRLVEAMSNE